MKTTKAQYYHLATIGTFELQFWGRDDRYVKRAVARWLRLFWPKACRALAERRPGSLADAINNGWDNPPEVQIGRWPFDGRVAYTNQRPVLLEKFEASPIPIAEFSRVFDSF